MSSHTSSPLSKQEVYSEDEFNGNEINTELEQLGVDLVDQNDLEKSLMEKVGHSTTFTKTRNNQQHLIG
jgi:hypothetical protein